MIKTSRKRQKITQSYLSRKTGLSQGYISKLENQNNLYIYQKRRKQDFYNQAWQGEGWLMQYS